MQQQSERRVLGVRRVPVERVVDVCERGAEAAAFRGRSVDISGRGMQLWASHPPELGAPLVLRFREAGQEIIAEGEVAWCNPGAQGGEFGVRFTALDSRSVQALKLLCQRERDVPGSGLAADVDGEDNLHDTDPAPPAAPIVKLHMAGLGEPMRAQLRGHGRSELEVSSQLDFLRLGRSVEVEEPSQGGQRRAASIAGVDVVVDRDSQVPELIVSMRYADAALTPIAPAVEERTEMGSARAVEQRAPELWSTPSDARSSTGEMNRALDLGPESGAAAEPCVRAEDDDELTAREPSRAPSLSRGEREMFEEDADEPERGSLDEEDLSEETERESALAEELTGPSDLERLRERMDEVVSGVTAAARVAGEQALRFGGAATRGVHWLARQARTAARPRPARQSVPKRRTTSVPPRSPLRTNPLLRKEVRQHAPPSRRTEAARPMGRAVVLGGMFVAAVAGGALWASRDATPDSAPRAVPATLAPDPPAAEEAPAPPRAPGPAETEDAEDVDSEGVVAQVPLFGPTEVGAKPEESRAVPLARVKVADESFGGGRAPKPAPKRVTSTEFGHGRLHLPIVYRLRLDEPGDGLRGERTPTGFDVVIPGRKTMESGSAISRRDDRIAKVITRNGTEGTRISFRFRGTIPAYKVRLRKDFVEFFISS